MTNYQLQIVNDDMEYQGIYGAPCATLQQCEQLSLELDLQHDQVMTGVIELGGDADAAQQLWLSMPEAVQNYEGAYLYAIGDDNTKWLLVGDGDWELVERR